MRRSMRGHGSCASITGGRRWTSSGRAPCGKETGLQISSSAAGTNKGRREANTTEGTSTRDRRRLLGNPRLFRCDLSVTGACGRRSSMRRGLVGPFILIVLSCLALPGVVVAQEATISGTVKDSTAGVLPGVAVRAVHEATGTVFEGFTDERGNFRIPVRIGVYRLTAELAGFATLQQM